MKSYYQILGLASAQASSEEIEAAYRHLLAEFAGNADYQKAISEAFVALSDPQRRAVHDRQLLVFQSNAAASQQDRAAGGSGFKWLGLVSLAVALLGYYYSTQPKPKPATVPTAVSVAESQVAAPAAAVDTEPAQPAPAAVQVGKPQEQIVVVQGPAVAAVRFTRPAKKVGFDAEYLSWTTYLVVGGRNRGSGVMVAPDKILTNCHVVAGNAMSGLVVINSATHERAKVDKYSKLEDDEDVCLLNAPGAPAYLAEWGRSESLDIGAATYTVSFPGNEGLTWSSGKLIRREYPLGMEIVTTSNYCRPGVSGGPLFDEKGLLIGITSAGRTYRGGGSECMSLTAETARKVLYKPMVPIALAPTQYDPAMLRR
ncbi:trypsin-like peptidase domain-containing protein [Dechloromonas sp. XY25]|uniref:Serine protease n=1 Tax=Dechloromonas hankyongensis TaxID=2908002 RepID=A0ABS9K3H4_9RHOO|nr:trypsin-like peptidase domain-containing protein [Dechloromonas hankyongensis]MCG2577686.1 trypsin-like peptidase domain-containing protein [Dechloromonas hankyongensis]